MNGMEYKNIIKFLETNQTPVIIFLTSLFIFITFSTTRLFLSDEAILLNQFYNFVHGSLFFQAIKIKATIGPHLLIDNHLYGKFSYSLIILSFPLYFILKQINVFYSAHLFIVQLWALCFGITLYLIAKSRGKGYAGTIGVLSYFALIAVNSYYFVPLGFPKWGELLSIELANIIISSFLTVLVYFLFRDIFNNRTAIFASFFVILATPVPFYAVSLKLHSLSLLLTVLAFYFLYKYISLKEDRFVYYAYSMAGLCIWTRILDGAVLLASLLIMDIIVLKRGMRHAASIFAVILISLAPLLTFNYLILGNPVSIIELTPSGGAPIKIPVAPNVIDYIQERNNTNYSSLKEKLGYIARPQVKNDPVNILLDTTILKAGNTFGIFLVSPFLILSIAFAFEWIKRRIRLTAMDTFFMLYTVLLFLAYIDYFLTIVTHTPTVLEYRYLLIMYIILLYFTLRAGRVREMVETELKTISLVYAIILITGIIYLVKGFPMPLVSIYFYAALVTSISLLIMLLINARTEHKSAGGGITGKLVVFTAALSLALASIFLMFYYLALAATYIPPDNYNIIPIMEQFMKWRLGSVQ